MKATKNIKETCFSVNICYQLISMMGFLSTSNNQYLFPKLNRKLFLRWNDVERPTLSEWGRLWRLWVAFPRQGSWKVGLKVGAPPQKVDSQTNSRCINGSLDVRLLPASVLSAFSATMSLFPRVNNSTIFYSSLSFSLVYLLQKTLIDKSHVLLKGDRYFGRIVSSIVSIETFLLPFI